MAEIVNSLFGIDPTQIEQNRRVQDFAEAYKLAQLSPLDRATAGIYMGSKQLGRAGQQLFGGDEELNKATQVRQLASQFDMTSPNGLRQFAQAVAPFAPEVAQQAIRRSDEIVTTGLKQAESIATTQAKLREKTLPTSGLGKLITERDALLAAGLPTNDPRVVAYDNAIKAEGEGKGTTVKVDLTGPKNVLEVDKKDAENLVKTRDALEKSVPLLQSSLNTLDKGIIGGTFSNARVAFNTALSSAGLSPIKNIEALANTKTFNANRVALASSIAKQLGVNPTDRDFQASLDRFAAASEDPRASKIFLTELLALQQQQLADANAGLEYFRKNQGSFSGYNRPLPKAFSAGPDLSNLSDDQLRQAINERKKANQK